METELARVERGRAMIVADALETESQQRQLLGKYVHQHMVENTDYGVIPGTKNKTLLKPGAEKLTQLFRCIPRYTVEDKIENHETGLFFYRYRCSIVTQADETVVAEGVGSCSTFESRYRWRNSERTCPNCGKPCIIKGKAEYGGGWLCFGKKGGCGAKFSEGDQAIEGQSVGRIQNPDLHDQANTVLKMAKKRALVDAAIALARCSDIFTQDAEDFADHHAPELPREVRTEPAPAKFDPATDKDVSHWRNWMASDPQLDAFNNKLPELAKLSPEAKRTVWSMIQSHGRACGWWWDEVLKSFCLPACQ